MNNWNIVQKLLSCKLAHYQHTLEQQTTTDTSCELPKKAEKILHVQVQTTF